MSATFRFSKIFELSVVREIFVGGITCALLNGGTSTSYKATLVNDTLTRATFIVHNYSERHPQALEDP